MLKDILRAAMFCPGPEGFWGLPLLLWGAPGEGKTALMRQFASTHGLSHVRMSPAEQGEGRFGVVPVPGPNGLTYPPPADLVEQLKEGGLLFLDEISTAPPALQAPLLGCVQLRTIGNHTFSARTRVIGAANEVKDAAGGWDLAPALSNRFGHLDYQGLEAQDYAAALIDRFAPGHAGEALGAAALEEHVMRDWPSADASARGMISSFIVRRPDLLRKRPEKGTTQKAWPSPRSVEYACVALAAAQVHRLSPSDTDVLVGAFVGNAWVSEFRAWSAMADLPDPAELLDGKVKFKHEPRRADRTMAVLSACAALVVPEKAELREERAVRLWELITAVLKDAPDLAIPGARAMVKAKLAMTTQRRDALSALHPTLIAAGIANA